MTPATQTTHRTRDLHVPTQREPSEPSRPDPRTSPRSRPVLPPDPDAGPQRSVVWGYRTPKPIAEQRAVARRKKAQVKPTHRRRTWWDKLWGRR